ADAWSSAVTRPPPAGSGSPSPIPARAFPASGAPGSSRRSIVSAPRRVPSRGPGSGSHCPTGSWRRWAGRSASTTRRAAAVFSGSSWPRPRRPPCAPASPPYPPRPRRAGGSAARSSTSRTTPRTCVWSSAAWPSRRRAAGAMTALGPADAKILIVDDERANVVLLERLLQHAGYRRLASTTDSRTVLELYRSLQPDLILLDLMMPHVDGFAVLAQLR